MKIERRLTAITERIAGLREELRVATEQLTYVADLEEEARTRMMVSDSPDDRAAHRQAAADVEVHRRNGAAIERQLENLLSERDRLLDRLSDGSGR